MAPSKVTDWLRDVVKPRRAPRPDIDPPEIGAIYARAAREGGALRNPVIFIPGIMGTRLVDASATQTLWGEFPKPWRGAKEAEFAAEIALPMEQGTPLDRLHGAVRPDGAVCQLMARLAGLPVELRAYGDILSAIGVGSYRGTYATGSPNEPVYGEETHAVSFEFAYDWRRSLDETAARLGDFMRLAARFVQARRRTTAPVHFDVVAHSMGGLILRYFLRYGSQRLPHDGSLPKLTWAGAARVDMAVVVGTPNAGTTTVLDRLVAGVARNPVHPEYDPAVCGTMPSLYQLLPRSRHGAVVFPSSYRGTEDLLSPELWRAMGWGLMGSHRDERLAQLMAGVASRAQRAEIATDHVAKCLRNARAFHAAVDRPVERPDSLEMHLIAGDAYRTAVAVHAVPREDRVPVSRYGPGDGTVSRSSALMDERLAGDWSTQLVTPIEWDSITFIRSNHMGLTRDPVFIDNVLYLLLEKPRRRRAVRRPPMRLILLIVNLALVGILAGCATQQPVDPEAVAQATPFYVSKNPETVRSLETFEVDSAGTTLGYVAHRGAGTAGAVVYLHGIESHAGWFDHAADLLCAAGYDVFCLDRRGSGINRENRGFASGDIDSFETLIRDVHAFAGSLRSRYSKIVLVGLSWGGKLGLACALTHPDDQDALVMITPGIRSKVGAGFFTMIKAFFSSVFQPRALISIPIEPEMFTKTPEVLELIHADPLRLHAASTRFFQQSDALESYIDERMADNRLPLLLFLAGQDEIIDNAAVIEALKDGGQGALQVINYEDQTHSIQFDAPERLVRDMVDWMTRVSSGQ